MKVDILAWWAFSTAIDFSVPLLKFIYTYKCNLNSIFLYIHPYNVIALGKDTYFLIMEVS